MIRCYNSADVLRCKYKYSAQRKQATKCQIKGDYARIGYGPQSFADRYNIKLSIITLHRRINITYAQTLHDDYTVGMCRK